MKKILALIALMFAFGTMASVYPDVGDLQTEVVSSIDQQAHTDLVEIEVKALVKESVVYRAFDVQFPKYVLLKDIARIDKLPDRGEEKLLIANQTEPGNNPLHYDPGSVLHR